MKAEYDSSKLAGFTPDKDDFGPTVAVVGTTTLGFALEAISLLTRTDAGTMAVNSGIW